MSKPKLTKQQLKRIRQNQQKRVELTQIDNSIQPTIEQFGLVVAGYGRQFDIEPKGRPGQIVRCRLRTNLPTLVAGDQVIFCAEKNQQGVIVACCERESELYRSNQRGLRKPIAVNIDYIILVLAPKPKFYTQFIDRCLALAESVCIEPVLLMNKNDLLEHPLDYKEQLADYANIGYQLLSCSAKKHSGLSALQKLMTGKKAVLVGQSGVGKSSLLNALLGTTNIKVGALSEEVDKGRHTTTASRLYHLPSGGSLIDSPGIADFGVWHMDYSTLLAGYREFQPFLGLCRFRDCRHLDDPGCALRQAVEEGKISQQRLDSLHKIAGSLAGNG